MQNKYVDPSQRRFNYFMNVAVISILFVGGILAGIYGMQQSQLASPDDGPVKFYWVIRGTEHGCLVLEKGTVTDCKDEKFTNDLLQHYPTHYEDPHVSFPGYFSK